MTWTDLPDDQAQRVTIGRDQIANLNAFTVAESDRQWFHHPGMNPPIATGQLLPLSRTVLRDYHADAARGTQRWQQTHHRIQARIGEPDLHNRAFEMIYVNPAQAPSSSRSTLTSRAIGPAMRSRCSGTKVHFPGVARPSFPGRTR